MKQAIATLRSMSAYSQSKYIDAEELEKESKDDYEKRTWRQRLTLNADGRVMIPPMAFKKSLDRAAAFLGMKIKGRGQTTYTKHFLAGVMCSEPMVLDVKADDVAGEWLFVPADGKPGGGKRVRRCFPVIPKWEGIVHFYVLDDTITEPIFRYHLEQAGNFIGIGRFRPERGGFYGRFQVVDLVWEDSQ